jgi:hypothetical protein
VSIELNFMTLLVAWACSEIIRYSFFALKVIGVLNGHFFTEGLLSFNFMAGSSHLHSKQNRATTSWLWLPQCFMSEYLMADFSGAGMRSIPVPLVTLQRFHCALPSWSGFGAVHGLAGIALHQIKWDAELSHAQQAEYQHRLLYHLHHHQSGKSERIIGTHLGGRHTD